MLCMLPLVVFPQKYSREHGDRLIQKKYAVDSKKEAKEAMENSVRYAERTQNFEIVENSNIRNAQASIKKKKIY